MERSRWRKNGGGLWLKIETLEFTFIDMIAKITLHRADVAAKGGRNGA